MLRPKWRQRCTQIFHICHAHIKFIHHPKTKHLVFFLSGVHVSRQPDGSMQGGILSSLLLAFFWDKNSVWIKISDQIHDNGLVDWSNLDNRHYANIRQLNLLARFCYISHFLFVCCFMPHEVFVFSHHRIILITVIVSRSSNFYYYHNLF